MLSGQAMIELTDYNLNRKIYTFFNGKYLLDIIYNNYFINSGIKLGYTTAKILDRGLIEVVGPFGLSNFLFNTGKNIGQWDTGIVTSYALYIVIGLISMIFVLFAPIIIGITPTLYTDSDNQLLIQIRPYIRLLLSYIPTLLFLIKE